jgi:flagellar biosynthesis/type III secretory pathway ATPase
VNSPTWSGDAKGNKHANRFEPPGARFRVGHAVLTMAEYFRDDEHRDVLLLIDTFSHLSASIMLSRKRASEGLFPAIDPLQSTSRFSPPNSSPDTPASWSSSPTLWMAARGFCGMNSRTIWKAPCT